MFVFSALYQLVRGLLVPRLVLVTENFALRQQLLVLRCSTNRPRLRHRDRLFWIALSQLWQNCRSILLIVTSGCGWVQSEGGPKEEIRPGDVVWCPPGEKHWHGATSTTAMTHIAIVEKLDGKAVDWMEKVSEEQYQAA